ncbi:MAG: fibronectin type III domain-containing protein [Candidatus Cyclobacteriaceae bacterium M2_1C_046]
MRKLFFFLILSALLLTFNAEAQVIVTYSFSSTVSPESQPANGTASNMVRGSGVTTVLSVDKINSIGWTTNSSIDVNDYYEFTISPNCGYKLNLTSLAFDESFGAVVAAHDYNWVVRSSYDNFASDIVAATTESATIGSGGTTNNSITLPANPFSSVSQAVTFRIYMYNAESGTMEWGLDNVNLNGSIVALTDLLTVNFENAGCGYTLSGGPGTTSNIDFFGRFDKNEEGTDTGGGDTHDLSTSYSSEAIVGNYYVAGRDINESSGSEGIVTLDAINVTNYENLSLSYDLAAPGGSFENVDYIIVDYEYDGSGSFTVLDKFTGINRDGTAESLSSTITTFTKSIPKVGTSLKIRLRFLNDNDVEQYLADNIVLSGTLDGTGPTPTITRNAVTNGSFTATTDNSVSFDIAFDEVVDNSTFTIADITINDDAGAVTYTAPVAGDLVNSGDNRNYTFTLNNLAGDGNISITLGTAINDLAGNTSTQVISSAFTIDNTAPEITSITSTESDSVSGNFFVTILFSEIVTGFASGDVSVTNGSVAGLSTIDNISYSVEINPNANQSVSVDVAAGVATDNAGNANNAYPTAFTIYNDETNPLFSTDNTENRTDVSIDYRVNVSENSWISLVVTTSSSQPTKAQIDAQNDHNNNAAVVYEYLWYESGADLVKTLSGLASNTTYYIHAYAQDPAGNQTSVESTSSFTTLKSEPSAHVTGVNSFPNSTTAIEIEWTDVNTGSIPDGYLIQFAANPASFTNPTDGVTVGNDANNQNVTAVTQTVSFSSLIQNTAYDFRIIPYTNSGMEIDYYLGGAIPSGTENTFKAQPSGSPAPTLSTSSNTEMTVTWADADVTGADGYLIQLRDKTSGTAFYTVTDGEIYPDDNGNNDSGNINTLNIGTGVQTVTFTTLDPDHNYEVQIFAYSVSGAGDKNYAGGSSTPELYTLNSEPAQVASLTASLVAYPNADDDLQIDWAQVPGARYLLYIYTGAAPVPSDGTELGDKTFDGTDGRKKITNDATIGHLFSGLDPNTSYNFIIYSYTLNGNTQANYNTIGAPTASATTAKLEPTNNPATLNYSSTSSTLTISWDDVTTGTVIPDGYILIARRQKGGVSYDEPADGTQLPNDTDMSPPPGDQNAEVYIAHSELTNEVTFTNLESGKDYAFKVWSYTNSGAQINYNMDNSNEETSIYLPSALTSTITPGPLAEPATIASTNDSNGEITDVFDFIVTDFNDDDNAGMDITKIRITKGANNNVSDWTSVIAGIELSDGTNGSVTDATETIYADSIVFSGINVDNERLGEIDKGETKTYTLKIFLTTSVNDDDILDFRVQASDFEVGGTAFEPTQEEESGPIEIEVIATAYSFVTQPPSEIYALEDVLNAGNPIQLNAVDANDNIDLDYSFGGANVPTSITVANADGILMNNIPTVASNLSNGVFTFPTNFQYQNIGNGTLTITDSPTGFSVISNAVTVKSRTNFVANSNGLSTGTLNSNSIDHALLGFSVSSQGPATINGLTVDANDLVEGKIKQVLLVESTDDNIYNAGIDLIEANVLDTFDVSVNPLVLKNSISIALDGLNTQRHFFIVADIEKNVNINTPALQLFLIQSGISINQGDINSTNLPVTGSLINFIDVSKPLVENITADIPVVTDANAGGVLNISVVFDEEMNTTIAPNLTLVPDGIYPNPTTDQATPTLVYDALNSSWLPDNKTFVAKYTVTDNQLLSVDLGVSVSMAIDSAGLTMDSDTHLSVFSIDMENPFSGTAVLSHTQIADSTAVNGAGDKRFVVTLSFSEDMDDSGTNDPTLTFDQTVSNTLTFDSDFWIDKQTYRAFYDVLDGNETLNSIGFTVTTGTDSSGNIMTASGFPGLFNIDNENPVVNQIETSINTISDSEVGTGTFEIVITYNEAMDPGTAPVITFPVEDPSLTISPNVSGSGWKDAVTYKAAYDVVDVNERILNIDVQVASAADSYGNIQTLYDEADVFHIDSENPISVLATPSVAIISDINSGLRSFSIKVDFSEEMDTTAAAPDPILSFPAEDPSATITLDSVAWNSFTQFEAFYNVNDVNSTLLAIDVDISMAIDTAGNVQLLGDFNDLFNIDMENPEVVSVTASTTLINAAQDSIINDAVAGTGTFTLTVVFNEPMDQTQGLTSGTQFLSFPTTGEDPLTTVTFNGATWTNSTTYVVAYDVVDLGGRIDNIDVQVQNALDAIGNTLNTAIFSDRFDVHMDNPTVVSVTPSHSIVGDPLIGTQTFSIAVEFNEPMVVGVEPTIDFPTVSEDPTSPNANLTRNGGSWDNTGTVFTALYDVDGSFDETINDIDVRVRFAIDSIANNEQVEITAPDVFTLNTQNPKVTGVTSPDADGFYREGDIITIEIILDQDVTVSTTAIVPKLGLNTGDSAVYVHNTTPNVLVFSYTVLATQNSADLGYNGINSFVLNGATIKDGALNDAVIDLPVPGAAGSLSTNKNIVIDTENPDLAVTAPFLPAADTFAVPVDADIQITFKEDIAFTAVPGLNVYLYNADSSILQTFDVVSNSGGILTISGNVLTVNNTFIFSESSSYTIGIDSAAIEDLAGNAYSGFTISDERYQFQTFGTPFISNLQNNSLNASAICVDSILNVTGRFFRGYSNQNNISTVTFHTPDNSSSVAADLGTLQVLSDTLLQIKVPAGIDTTAFRISIDVNSDASAIGTNPARTSEISIDQSFIGPYAADLVLGTSNISAVCSEGAITADLAINISGGNGNYSFIYQVNGSNNNSVSNYINGSNFNVDPPTANDNDFTIFELKDLNNCPVPTAGIDADPITIIEHTQPKITSITDLAGLCLESDPSSIEFEATVTGSTTTGTWSIQNGSGSLSSTNYNFATNDTTETYSFASSDFQLDTLLIKLTTTATPAPCINVTDFVVVTYTNDRVANLKGDKSVCKLTNEDPVLTINASIAGDPNNGIWKAYDPTFTAATGYFTNVQNKDTTVIDNNGAISNTYTFSSADKEKDFIYLILEPLGGTCGDVVSDTVKIVVKDLPVPNFTLNDIDGENPTNVCAEDSFLEYNLYNETPPAGSSYTWVVPAFSGDIISGGGGTVVTTTGSGANEILTRWKNVEDSTAYLKIVETNIEGCSSDTVRFNIIVNQEPVPTFVTPTTRNFANSLEPLKLTGSGASISLTNHFFSGPGVVYKNTVEEKAYYFSPENAGIGTHPVSYTYTNPVTTCSATVTDDFIVFDGNESIVLLNSGAPLSSSFCEYEENDTITISNFVDITPGFEFYDFIGTGIISNDLSTQSAVFSPTTAFQLKDQQSSVITISYRIIDPMTNNIDTLGSQDIQINKITTPAIITPIIDYCSNSAIVELERNEQTNPLETYKFFVYSGGPDSLVAFDSTVSNFIFYPEKVIFNQDDFIPRDLIISYEYTDINGCIDTVNFETSVSQQPYKPVVENVVLCQDDNMQAFQISNVVADAAFSWRNTSNTEVGRDSTFLPALSTTSQLSAGYSVTQTINNCPSETTAVTLDVLSKPAVAFDIAGDNEYCFEEGSVAVAVSPAPGTNAVFKGDTLGLVKDQLIYDPVLASGGTNQLVEDTLYYVVSLLHNSFNKTCRDSVEQVVIVNPLPHVEITTTTDVICADGDPIELNGNQDIPGVQNGMFSAIAGVTGTAPNQIFSPKGEGVIPGTTYPVTYLFTDNKGCSDSDTLNILVNRLPQPDFKWSTADLKDYAACDDQVVLFTDLTPTNIVGEQPVEWLWNFRDLNATAANDTSDLQNPSHIYSEIGDVDVRLDVISAEGCENFIEKQVIVHPIPTVNFDREFIVAGDATEFTPNFFSQPLDTIESLTWNFDGMTETVTTDLDQPYPFIFTSSGFKNVDVTILSEAGCFSTTTDSSLFILPKEKVTTAVQFDFESDDQGWLPVASLADLNVREALWKRGIPNGYNISATASDNVWMTGLEASPIQGNVDAYLYSPAFDFTDLERPMMSFRLFNATDAFEDNGLVVQYTTEGKSKGWTTLGEVDQGDNWYNSQRIDANPGNQEGASVGWSSDSSGWVVAALDLSIIPPTQRDKVIFRFAFATDANLVANDGAAIDNFFIGERTRTILLEHFTNIEALNNTSSELDQEEFVKYKQDDEEGVEIVKLTYHTAFPGEDLINKDNSGDVGSRVLYYNVNSITTTIMDGNLSTFNNEINEQKGTYTPFASWVNNQFTRRTLKPSKVTIDTVQAIVQNSAIKINAVVTPDVDISEDLVVHVAVVEKGISFADDLNLTTLPAGIDSSTYVLKKLLPDARGSKFQSPESSETLTVEEIWEPGSTKVYSLNDLAIVVFVQGNTSKDIYQSSLVSNIDVSGLIVTGTDNDEIKLKDLTIYPVPASDHITLSYPYGWEKDQQVQVFDQSGKLVMIGNWGADQQEMEIKTSRLPDGMYFVQIEDPGSGVRARKKFMVIHR